MGREVVNFPSAESDLRPISRQEIGELGSLKAASGRDVREWQAGIALWPRLLWIALALLLCEGAVAAFDSVKRPARKQVESREAGRGAP